MWMRARQCLRGLLVTGMWLTVLLLHLVLEVSKIPYFSHGEFQLGDGFELFAFVGHWTTTMLTMMTTTTMRTMTTTTHSADSFDDHCMEQHGALDANVLFHWHEMHSGLRRLCLSTMMVFSLDLWLIEMGQRMMHGFYLHGPILAVSRILQHVIIWWWCARICQIRTHHNEKWKFNENKRGKH